MKIVWVGFHFEGLCALESLIEEGIKIEGVITLSDEEAAKRSGSISYQSLCTKFHIPIYEIHHINDPESISILKRLNPDIIFVIGWSQIVGSEVLRIPKIGIIGAHASLLPHNRGSAPINWSIIKGEVETGNTLIWLSEGVDEGEIIDQMRFPITPFDTCETLYNRVAETNKIMVLNVLKKTKNGEKPAYKQASTKQPVLPRRRPKDGLIDWENSKEQIYNFIRALTRPYPGAFTYLDGKKVMIWKSALIPGIIGEEKTGRIIGPVFSPVEDACGLVVECGTGCILILEMEYNGKIIKGKELAMIQWNGKVFKNE